MCIRETEFYPRYYCRIMSPEQTYTFSPYHTVVPFVNPLLLLLYLRQGFETCYTVQTCIWHVHKGSRILIQVIFSELYNPHTCSPFVIALGTSFINRYNISYIGNDDSCNKFTFQVGRGKVKITVAIFREKKHCHPSSAFI